MKIVRQIALMLSVLTGTAVTADAHLLGTDYKQLKYWFMRSNGIEKENFTQSKEIMDKTESPDFLLPKIDEQTRQYMVYDILQTLKRDLFAPVSASFEQLESLKIVHRDLEVFCGDGAHPSVNLAASIDRSHSAAGSAVMRKMLANPVASSDFKKFKARQELIRKFVENEEFLNSADALCVEMAKNEERLLSNWQDVDAVSSEVFEKSYFQNRFFKGFNTSPVAMETLTRLGNLGTAFVCTNELLFYYVFNMITKRYQQDKGWGEAFMETSQSGLEIIKAFNPFVYYRNCKQNLITIEDNFENKAWAEMRTFYEKNNLPAPTKEDAKASTMKIAKGIMAIQPAFVAFYGAYKAYVCRDAYKQAKLTKDAINFLQDKLIGFGNLVRLVESLEVLGEKHAELAEGLVTWQYTTDLLHRTEKDGFASLVKLLQTNTFVGESSFFSLSGRVLAASKLAAQERDNFAGAIELMGELDACVSAAKLYKQFADRQVNFCFADIAQENRPYIALQGFWNPFIDHNVVVANDLELGGSCVEQHVVLTGSNTGGKSTVGLKGTLISMYLAHTLGLAPASRCESSVFTDFSSYIHVVDDVASGESAFQAEINRANSLIKAVQSLNKDQFAFVVIDELFKGTSPEKGAPGACKVIQYLAGYDNVIFIIATHFKEMTKLADDNNLIVNMKIEIFEDEAGNLIKPYKLEKGISTHNIADNLMESGLNITGLSIA